MNPIVTAALVSAGIAALIRIYEFYSDRQAQKKEEYQQDKAITTAEFEKLLERQSHYIDTLEAKINNQIEYINELERLLDGERDEIMDIEKREREWLRDKAKLERELEQVKRNHEEIVRKYNELVGTQSGNSRD